MDVEGKIEDYLEKVFLDGSHPFKLILSADLYHALHTNFMSKAIYTMPAQVLVNGPPVYLTFQSSLFNEPIEIQCGHWLAADTIKADFNKTNGIERALEVLERAR
jgi:hypothetical protein